MRTDDRCEDCIRYGQIVFGEFVVARLADWPYRPSAIFQPPSPGDHDTALALLTGEQARPNDGTEPVRGGPKIGFDVSKSDARKMRAWLMGHPIDVPKPVPSRFKAPAHFTVPPMPAPDEPCLLPARFQKYARGWEPIRRRGTKHAR